jgi:hypothetical protein
VPGARWRGIESGTSRHADSRALEGGLMRGEKPQHLRGTDAACAANERLR